MNNYIKDKKKHYINLFTSKKNKTRNINELSLILEDEEILEFQELPKFVEKKEESKYWNNICKFFKKISNFFKKLKFVNNHNFKNHPNIIFVV